jgi:hypothetical protein
METVAGSARWHRAVAEIAASSGYQESLLRISLRALLSPLHEAAELARKVKQRRELFGFIMPGNVPGSGIHELVTALAAGSAVIVKTSSSEPLFFSELAATLRGLDTRFGSDLGARLEVFNWTRERVDLTDTLFETCDHVVAFGDDATIAQLDGLTRTGRLIAFGARFSAAAVIGEALQGVAMELAAKALALDCAMFDQRGCLSPHHIFVEDHACEFASKLAAAFFELVPVLGRNGVPPRREPEEAAAIRRMRETARWRKLGGGEVELWEDSDFNWTVVFDREARFTLSPGFRAVYVSPFVDPPDLERRLEPVRGRLEGFVIARGEFARAAPAVPPISTKSAEISRLRAIQEVARRCGATHICAPGEMQSPPLDWPHGGGEFIRMFLG